MVKEEPVSLLRQTIYCFIPILNLYAAYKIRRLRRYLLIMIFLVEVPISIIGSITYQFVSCYYLVGGFVDELVPRPSIAFDCVAPEIFIIATSIGPILIAIYLIRRWSAQWNLRFSTPTE